MEVGAHAGAPINQNNQHQNSTNIGSQSVPLITAALAYAGLGWHVFPCHTPIFGDSVPVRCSCGKTDCHSIGKHPRTAHGLKEATTGTEQITAWWTRWPNANIAIATGPSGLAVLDVDGPKGEAALAHVEKKLGWLCDDTTGNITGRGVQFVFTGHIKSVARFFGLDGLDTRGEGGYIIAPPSMHPLGMTYLWSAHYPWHKPKPWPKALARMTDVAAKPPPRPAVVAPKITNGSNYVAAAMRGELARVTEAPNGERNHALNRAAFSLGRLITEGRASRDEIESALLAAAHTAKLSDSEARKTIASGFRAQGVPA